MRKPRVTRGIRNVKLLLWNMVMLHGRSTGLQKSSVKKQVLAMLLFRLGSTSKQLTANFLFIQVDKMSKDVGWLMEQPVRSACQTGL